MDSCIHVFLFHLGSGLFLRGEEGLVGRRYRHSLGKVMAHPKELYKAVFSDMAQAKWTSSRWGESSR